jgi:hypothetical protein
MFRSRVNNKAAIYTSISIDYSHLATQWPYGKCKSRATETAITRLRLKRSRLRSDLIRWGLVENDTCLRCGIEAETTIHVFFHCPALADDRRQLLPLYGAGTDIEKIFVVLSMAEGAEGECRSEFLGLIEKFIKAIGIIPE